MIAVPQESASGSVANIRCQNNHLQDCGRSPIRDRKNFGLACTNLVAVPLDCTILEATPMPKDVCDNILEKLGCLSIFLAWLDLILVAHVHPRRGKDCCAFSILDTCVLFHLQHLRNDRRCLANYDSSGLLGRR